MGEENEKPLSSAPPSSGIYQQTNNACEIFKTENVCKNVKNEGEAKFHFVKKITTSLKPY